MNHLVEEAFGIDSVIKRIQEQIYAELVALWSSNLNGYGRVYKNHKDYQKIPEVFLASEGDYSDSFYDDSADANFFFLESDLHETNDEVLFTNKMKVVFSLDLTECYDGNDRLDALAHKDALEIFRNIPSSGKYKVTGYETGLEKIFSGFSIKGIKNQDIHPTHVFAVLIDLSYKLTDKCS